MTRLLRRSTKHFESTLSRLKRATYEAGYSPTLGDVAGARAELSRTIRLGDRQTRAKAINLLVALESLR